MLNPTIHHLGMGLNRVIDAFLSCKTAKSEPPYEKPISDPLCGLRCKLIVDVRRYDSHLFLHGFALKIRYWPV